MEGIGLVIQHDIVAHRQGDDEVHARGRQQDHEVLVGILIGVGMVRIAAVTAHRQAVQLAHEMVFKPGPDDLLMVV